MRGWVIEIDGRWWIQINEKYHSLIFLHEIKYMKIDRTMEFYLEKWDRGEIEDVLNEIGTKIGYEWLMNEWGNIFVKIYKEWGLRYDEYWELHRNISEVDLEAYH